jgi:hypothetical protein
MTPKINPQSKKLLMDVIECLKENGVADMTTRVRCSQEMVIATNKHLERVKQALKAGKHDDIDKSSEQWAGDLTALGEKYKIPGGDMTLMAVMEVMGRYIEDLKKRV